MIDPSGRVVLQVNLDGAFLCLREAARVLVGQGQGGSLVGVSSTSAVNGAPGQQHYAASKTALLAVTRGLAVELARHKIRIAALTASVLHGIEQNLAVPAAVTTQASTELAGGIPFLSDADLQKALTKAGASKQIAQAVLDESQQARLDGLRTALAALALLALVALFFSTQIPARQPGSARTRQSEPQPDAVGAQTP